MEKNRIIRGGADLRVLEFLKNLQNNIYDSNLVGISQMARKHKIGVCYGAALTNLKIIKRVGHKKYLWLGSNPSLLMARKILKYYSENYYKNVIENKQIEIKFKEPVKRKYTKRQDIKQTENKKENNIYSLNILWGLIKIQKS